MRNRFTVRTLCVFALTLLCAVAGAQNPTHIPDVVYGHKLGMALTMDVYKPEKPNGIGVLWMVSGGWVSNHEGQNVDIAKFFTSHGQTVFEVEHGSQPRFTIPEITSDIARAVRFIRVHAADYQVDPNRLGISGASSGGHLSLYTAAFGDDGRPNSTDPVEHASSRVQAVACFFPPVDFTNYGKLGMSVFDAGPINQFWPAWGVTEATPKAERDRLARLTSPIFGVTAKMPPTLIIQGTADPLVPDQQARLFMAKLEELKIPHKLELRPGKGHGWPDIGPDFTMLADWFTKYLGKK